MAHLALTKGNGKGIEFLRAHVATESDECISWPFSKLPKGYGTLGWNGDGWRAHRLMCCMVYGDPPTPKHYACHSCNTPDCVNPRHLRWGTSRENHLDQRPNGTQATGRGRFGALEPEQVKMIAALNGVSTQARIAEQFGVSEETVRRIHNGLTYKRAIAS